MAYADLNKKRETRRRWYYKNKEKQNERDRERKRKSENLSGTKSMQTSERGMREIDLLKRENRILAASKGIPIAVSERQFETVRLEQLTSLNLLNSSGDVLLSAMNSLVPPEGSMRTIGDYTGQNMRQLAKSICDIVQTKAGVVRQMYQITRDEY